MKTARGFSLVEVVLAVGICSFVLSALFGLLVVSLNSDRASNLDTVLPSIAQQVSDRLRTTSYSELLPTYTCYFDADGGTAEMTEAFYQVTATPQNSENSFKIISLELTWPVGAAHPFSCTLQKSIADYGF